MADKIAVYIPTPGGPVRVEDLGRYRGLKTCLARRGNEMDALPVTTAYHAFVDAMASVRHDAAAWFASPDEDGPATFELRLSDAIESGDSWRLALLAAHGLAHQGRLARDAPEDAAVDRAETVLWATGDLGRNLDVMTVGHLADKLEASRQAFADWHAAGLRIVLALPAELRGEIDPMLPSGAEVVWATNAEQVFTNLGLAATPPAEVGETAAPAARRWPAAILAIALVALTGFLVWPLVDGAETSPGDASPEPIVGLPPVDVAPSPVRPLEAAVEPAPPAAPPVIHIFERRAAPGETCAGVHFGTAEVVESELAVDGDVLPPSRLTGLCGLRFRVETADDSELIVTMVVESGALLRGAGVALPVERAFSGHGEWAIDLPRRMAGSLAYTITATTSKTDSVGAAELLVRALAHKVVP